MQGLIDGLPNQDILDRLESGADRGLPEASGRGDGGPGVNLPASEGGPQGGRWAVPVSPGAGEEAELAGPHSGRMDIAERPSVIEKSRIGDWELDTILELLAGKELAGCREVTAEQVRQAEDRLNHRPRKVLDYHTPHEVFHEGLSLS